MDAALELLSLLVVASCIADDLPPEPRGNAHRGLGDAEMDAGGGLCTIGFDDREMRLLASGGDEAPA